jgi:DNA-binding CsgD family transcriptional regulator
MAIALLEDAAVVEDEGLEFQLGPGGGDGGDLAQGDVARQHYAADGVAPGLLHPAELEMLTPRQMTVLRLLGEAKSNKQIAYDLNISQETVKIHISAILQKLGASSRAQAVMMAHQMREFPKLIDTGPA